MRPTATSLTSATDPTWAQRLGEQFAYLRDAYLTPLGELITAFLVVVATILLAARLAPLLFRTWPRLGDPRERATALAVGVAAGVLAAALLTAGIAGSVDGPRPAGALAVALLALAVLGTAGWLWDRGSSATMDAPPGTWFRSRAQVSVLVTAWLVLATLVIARVTSSPAVTIAWVGLGVLCGLGAVLLLGWWLATRLRLAITARTADGSEDPATAALVTALLGDLGASPPRGLEVPTGADTTELSDALAAIPGAGSVATRLGTFVAGLLGVTPWRAQVAAVEGSCLAVRVSRSGHAIGSIVIRPSDGRDRAGTTTPAVDLQRLAAAYLLTTLDAHHGPFPGLVGATSWRSLGLHYIATTDLAGDPRHTEVVARAAAIDPDSGLAAMAWRHALWRRSTITADLDTYLEWLEAFAHRHARDEQALRAVLLRTAYCRAAVALNRSFLPGDPPPPHQYRDAHRALVDLLARTSADPTDDGWLSAQIRAAVECLPAGPKGSFGPPPVDVRPTTPTAFYNLGCWWASSTPPDHARAAGLLSAAVTLPSMKAALRDDPQLAGFRASQPYRATFLADPRTDFFALPPLAPYTRVLASLAYTSPESLAPADADPSLLVVLGVAGRARVTGLAELCVALADDPVLGPLRVEILHELAGHRLLTPADLAALPAERRVELATTVLAQIDARCTPQTPPATPQSLLGWWEARFPTPAS